MTLNIWNLSGPWRERRVEIAEWIRRLAPDIVCLQEIVENTDGQNQARWFADDVGGYTVAYAGRDIGNGLLVGNAVLTRWSVDQQHDRDLTSTPEVEGEVPRLVVHARTNGLDVFATHLNFPLTDGVVRETQVQELVAFVDDVSDREAPMPPIVAGDFNAEPDSTEIRFLSGLASLGGRSVYFQDAWRVAGDGGPGWTWNNHNPFAAAESEANRRIDYVFAGQARRGGAGRVESARVVCDRALTGTFASDHFGLITDIALP